MSSPTVRYKQRAMMDGQFEDGRPLIDEVDLGEREDDSCGNLSDAREAEEAADRIMGEEQDEITSSDTTSKEDVGDPEPEGKQEKELTHAEASVSDCNYGIGRLIRLVKPTSPLERVDQVVFEFTRGRFAKRSFVVESSCIYVMGFNLAKANLALFLDYGEKCIVKYKHNQNRVTNITLWIGPANVQPMVPSTDPSFKRWLDRKDLSINDFNAWIKNSVDPVPFCPWKEDIYAGTVIDMVYDDAGVATGVVLKLKLLYHKVNVNPLDDFSRSSYAFLSRDDFFVWGNSVGICDLQFLLKKSQSVLMQIFERADVSVQKCLPVLPEKTDVVVRYTAYIGWVGNVRPSAQKAFQVDSADMLDYLSKRNLTLENFEAMRDGFFTHEGGKKKTQPQKQQTTKVIPLVGAHAEPDKTTKEIPRRSTLKDRLGYKSSSSKSGFCCFCRKKNDVVDESIAIGTDLIRAVTAIKSENDPNIDELLKTQEEFDLAIKLTSTLSNALFKRFDMPRFRVQRKGQDIRSEMLRPRSPQREYRSRRPKRDYRSRTPQRDCRSRSPKRDCISSPSQNPRCKSPIESNHGKQDGNYYNEKNVVPAHQGQAGGKLFDPMYPPETFSAPFNLGQSERSTYNFFVDGSNDARRKEFYNIFKTKPGDQDSLNEDQRSLPRPIVSPARIIDPSGDHRTKDRHQIMARSNSGHESRRQNDDVFNDMLSWDVHRVDEELQRLSDQSNKMKEIRDGKGNLMNQRELNFRPLRDE